MRVAQERCPQSDRRRWDMPSNFLEFNQGLPQLDKWKNPEDKIQEIMNYIKQLTEQLRYEFRHITVQSLDADKVTSGIFPLERGGTGAATASGARENIGLEGLSTITEKELARSSLMSGTWQAVGEVELGRGVWLVTLDVSFAANTTGRRAISIDESLPTYNAVAGSGSQTGAASGGNTVLHFTKIIGTTGCLLQIGAYQDSGTALDMNIARVRTIRLCEP